MRRRDMLKTKKGTLIRVKPYVSQDVYAWPLNEQNQTYSNGTVVNGWVALFLRPFIYRGFADATNLALVDFNGKHMLVFSQNIVVIN